MRHQTKSIFASGFLLLGFSALEARPQLVDPDATPETVQLYEHLEQLMPMDAIAFGNQYSMYRGIDDGVVWTNGLGRSDYMTMVGSHPAVSGWDLNEVSTSHIASLRLAYTLGVINSVSFHMPNPVTLGSSTDTSINMEDILPGGQHHDKLIVQLDRAYNFLSRLWMNPERDLVPVIFRPYHEMSGSWFWWGNGHATPEQFTKLWQFTVEYLRDVKGLHNLLYCYSPDEVGSVGQYLKFWPGDDYVDIIGQDSYLNDSDSPIWMTSSAMVAAQVAEEKGRVAILSEIGAHPTLSDSSINDWWSSRFLEPLRNAGLLNKFAIVMGWANWAPDHWHVPWPGSDKEAAFKTFLNDDQILLLDDLPEPPAIIGDWHEAGSLGWISTADFPWSYHFEHGWIYFFADSIREMDMESIWFFDSHLGWLWTSDRLFPNFYSFAREDWLFFAGFYGDYGRSFYISSEDSWIAVPLSGF